MNSSIGHAPTRLHASSSPSSRRSVLTRAIGQHADAAPDIPAWPLVVGVGLILSSSILILPAITSLDYSITAGNLAGALLVTLYCLFLRSNSQVAKGTALAAGMTPGLICFYVLLTLDLVLALGVDAGTRRATGNLIGATAAVAAGAAIIRTGGGLGRQLRLLLQPYVILATAMSLCGLAVWFASAIGAIDVSAWATETGTPKEGAAGVSALYSMPLGLSLILIGEGEWQLFGLSFVRLTGWTKEPHLAALFVLPAMFVVHYAWPQHSVLTKISRATIGLFALLTGSITGVVCAAGVLVVWLLARRRPLSMAVTLCIAAAVGSWALREAETYTFQTAQADRDLLAHKLGALPGMLQASLINNFELSPFEPGFATHLATVGATQIGLLPFLLYGLTTGLAVASGYLLIRRCHDGIGLALLYIAFHSLKDPAHVFEFPLVPYFLYVAGLASLPALSGITAPRNFAVGDKAVTSRSSHRITQSSGG